MNNDEDELLGSHSTNMPILHMDAGGYTGDCYAVYLSFTSQEFAVTMENSRAAMPNARYVEIAIKVDGVIKEFTLQEFKERLGF